MDDIIFSIPMFCGEKDCPVGVHIQHYWICDDGTYSVCDSDGNHEDIDEADLPTQKEQDDAWREYARNVICSGTDPLGQYYVKHTTKVRERWQFKINNSIVGPVMAQARRAGREYHRGELPERIVRYLNVNERGKLTDFTDWKSLNEAQPDIRPGVWWTVHIEDDKPRNPATVARELKRIARRQLKKIATAA